MEVLGVASLTAVADAGDDNERELAACNAAGAMVYVPIPDKHKAVTGQGRLSGQRSHGNRTGDVSIGPAGEVLPPRGQPQEKNRRPARPCHNGPLKAVYLPSSGAPRSFYRSEQADLVAAYQHRMGEQGPTRMRPRAGLVEHPFGTLKRWLGWATSSCVASRRSGVR